MIGTIVKDPAELQLGRWYAIGIEDELDQVNWAGALILRYEGPGCWFDEDGEQVEFVRDPLIDDDIRVDDADAFALQGAAVTATCAPELADFIDPSGALRKAGLLKVT